MPSDGSRLSVRVFRIQDLSKYCRRVKLSRPMIENCFNNATSQYLYSLFPKCFIYSQEQAMLLWVGSIDQIQYFTNDVGNGSADRPQNWLVRP